MEHQAKQVVTEFLAAVQQVNTEKLATLLHPEVKWQQPGNNSISGSKHSVQEVFEMVGAMFATTANTLQLTAVRSVCVQGNRVACLLHWKASKPTGEQLDVENIDVYTVADGKIVQVEIFTADEAAEDLFWGR